MIDDGAWLGFVQLCWMGYELAGAVVGAGAVVTHDVPDGAIVVLSACPCCEYAQQQSRREQVDPVGRY